MKQNDDNHSEITPWIEPELEARVVAWVAGEASAFEIAELERLIQEKPEIGVFKNRIEATHALVREASKPDQDPYKLSAERREKLLAAITTTAGSGNTPTKPEKPKVVPYVSPASRKSWHRYWPIAATVAFGFALTVAMGKWMIRKDSSYDAMRQAKIAETTKRKTLAQENATESSRLSDSPEITPSAPPPLPAISDSGHVDRIDRETAAGGLGREKNERIVADMAHRRPPHRDDSAVLPPALETEKPAQTNSDVTDDGVVKMERFVATEGGYGPSSTLAGSRINANVRDRSLALPQPTLPPLRGAEFSGVTVNEPRSRTWKKQTTFSDRASSAPVAGTNQSPLVENGSAETELRTHGYSAAFSGASIAQESLKINADKDSMLKAKLPSERGAIAATAESTLAGSRLPWPANAERKSNSLVYGIGSPVGIPPASKPVEVAASDDTVVLSAFEVAAPPKSGPTYNGRDKKMVDHPGAPTRLARAKATPTPHPTPIPRPTPTPSPVVPANVLLPNGEVSAAQQPVSTFSLHVSDVSFHLAQVALAAGRMPEADRIRPEEFYNAFDYGDPAPSLGEKVACHVEQSADPVRQQRNLVRIAMRVPSAGRGAGQPLRLTILLDTSGSMEREDRAAAVRRALEALVSLLGPADRVTLVGFAREPHLLAEQVAGDKAGQLLEILTHTPTEGGTNLEEALKLGAELARRQQLVGAQNRIVLLTDGAANLGDADPSRLASAVVALRQQGIAFDACGVGLDGIDDTMLEALTRKGDGRYYVLNTPAAADAGFARQLAGAFRPAAENVKVQVRFNPARVGAYRLIGFDQHRLKEEDFRNDKVDAAELAADEAAVALYEVEALPQGQGELGEVYVRFRDASTGNMIERSWTLPYNPQAAAFDRATPSMKLAGLAALLAERLRGGSAGNAVKLDDLASVVTSLRSAYPNEPRVQQLVGMYEQLRRMSAK